MPKLSLATALRIKAASGEVTALKGAGWQWKRASTAFARTALSWTDKAIHSGHSLTDTYVNGSMKDVFVTMQPGLTTDQHAKSTIPGSATVTRWSADYAGELNPRDHMSQFAHLVITERGLDVVGVAPYTHEQFLEDILFELKFAERVVSLNKEMTLWSIWPAIDWPNWQATLADYGNRFKWRAEYLQWKVKQLHPTWEGQFWICPGHLFMQRLFSELPPGVTAITDLFRESDPIHPNAMVEHGAGIFMLTYLYQRDLRELTGLLVPAWVTTAQDTYFKRISWEILTAYGPAGMGGAEGMQTVWDGFDWHPTITTPAELLMVQNTESGQHWEPPPGPPIDPVTVDGYVTSIPEIVVTGSPTALASLTPSVPAGGFYGIMAVTPDAVQPGSAALLLTLRNGGTNVASLNLRSDLNGILFENDPSGGNHANANQSGLSGKLVIEFWISAGGGGFITVNGKEYSSSGMVPATVAATSYRIGEGGWGPEPFSGTLHGVALFGVTPSATDRAGMRLWMAEA